MMSNDDKDLEVLLGDLGPNVEDGTPGRYSRLGLAFNPFPASGTATSHSLALAGGIRFPDPNVMAQMSQFVRAALLVERSVDDPDRYVGGLILGDYGFGKTQLLMYMKYWMEHNLFRKKYGINPYVIYIENPGVKVSSLLSSIIAAVGYEAFRRYLWNYVLRRLGETMTREAFEEAIGFRSGLFPGNDPWAEESIVNYRTFLTTLEKAVAGKQQRAEFKQKVLAIFLDLLEPLSDDPAVRRFLLEVLDEEASAAVTWDDLANAASKSIDRREVHFLNALITLLHCEKYTHVIMLVDEFEDVTSGRLAKGAVDNYLYNLRGLVDRERRWSVLLSMTELAYSSLRRVSPPLADRISAIEVRLKPWSAIDAIEVISRLVEEARKVDEDVDEDIDGELELFDSELVSHLVKKYTGNPRRILSACFMLVERAASTPDVELPLTQVFAGK